MFLLPLPPSVVAYSFFSARSRTGSGDRLRPNRELVDPAGDGSAADAGEVDRPGDLVNGQSAVGEEAVEVESADAGKDMPDERRWDAGEGWRAKVAAEKRSGRAVGMASQMGV